MLEIVDCVRTVRLVNQYGYDGAALSDGVCRHAIKKRINRLESKLGLKYSLVISLIELHTRVESG